MPTDASAGDGWKDTSWGTPGDRRPDEHKPTTAGTDLPGDPLARWALEQIEKCRTTVGKWRKQAMEADRFAAGKHFSKADLELLEAEMRPTSVFNAAQKWLRYIGGIERQSKLDIHFLPRQVHDEMQARAGDLVTKAYEWVLQNCNGDSERSMAFDDMLRRGMGWTDTQFDRSMDASGNINVKRTDGLEMLWDVRSTSPCVTEDARWVGRERQISKTEALKRWGDKHRAVILANVGVSSSSSRPQESVLISEKEAIPITSGVEWPTIAAGNVRVVEFQWYDEVVGVYFVDPLSGKDDWLDEATFAEYQRRYKKLFGGAEIDHDKMFMRQYQRIVIIGQTVVAGPFDLPGKRFTFNCVTGQRDEEDCIHYGFMRLLMDPQKYMTKYANQVMEIISRQAKGGLLAEEDAFVNPQEAEQAYARPGSITLLKRGGLQLVKDKEQPSIPPASIEMFQVCNQMMRDVTGISPEVSMGMGGGDQPALTMRQRQSASTLLLAHEFDNLRRYRENEAKTIFDFLQFIADDRIVRVGGPFDAEAVKLIRQPFFLEYDVVMDEGTRDPNVREQYMATIERLAPTLIRTNNFLPEMIDFFPLPASLKFSIKQAMARQAEMQQQLAQKGLSMGGRGKPISFEQVQAQTQLTKAQAAEKLAKAQKLADDMQASKSKMLLEAIIKKAEMDAAQKNEVMKQQGEMTRWRGDKMAGMVDLAGNLFGQAMKQGGGTNEQG